MKWKNRKMLNEMEKNRMLIDKIEVNREYGNKTLTVGTTFSNYLV